MSLYKASDPVIILDDASFIGKNCKIRRDKRAGAGILKVYAPWCPHCQAKVPCVNRLAELLNDIPVPVYVLNADDNPIVAEHMQKSGKLLGYPTFLDVSDDGIVGGPLRNGRGEGVYTVPDIAEALCQRWEGLCEHLSDPGLHACN